MAKTRSKRHSTPLQDNPLKRVDIYKYPLTENVNYFRDVSPSEPAEVRAHVAASSEDSSAEQLYDGPPLSMWDIAHDDLRKCTGRRLAELGIVKEYGIKQRHTGIVLSPHAEKALSIEDVDLVERNGIAVVNCGWDVVDKVPSDRYEGRGARLLPYLRSGNPATYCQPSILTSAEALAAGLYILGFKDSAEQVMEHFTWGHNFWNVNGEMLDAYSKCETSENLIHVQERFMLLDEKKESLRRRKGKGFRPSREEEKESG